jgi:hypothetical protein
MRPQRAAHFPPSLPLTAKGAASIVTAMTARPEIFFGFIIICG